MCYNKSVSSWMAMEDTNIKVPEGAMWFGDQVAFADNAIMHNSTFRNSASASEKTDLSSITPTNHELIFQHHLLGSCIYIGKSSMHIFGLGTVLIFCRYYGDKSCNCCCFCKPGLAQRLGVSLSLLFHCYSP